MKLRCADCGEPHEEVSGKQPYCPACLGIGSSTRFNEAEILLDDPEEIEEFEEDLDE